MSSPTIATEDIIWRVANLASWKLQERYIIHGTKDEYLLPNDLLESIGTLQDRIDRSENKDVLTHTQKSALEHLIAYVDANAEEALAPKTREEFLVHLRGECWNQLRHKANEVLKLFGMDAPTMTLEEIEALSL